MVLARRSLVGRSPFVVGPVLWIATLGSTGCGTGATTSGSGDGSSDAGTSAPDTGGTMSTSSTASNTADASDDAAGCPAFEDDASPGSITLEVTNMRADGVWLPMSANCIDPVPWALAGPGGTGVAWRDPGCGTCEGAVQGNCPCPPPFCDEVTALFLEPGATVRYTWAGLVYVGEDIPAACPGVDACGTSCARAVVADPGSYAFTVEAGGAMGCAVEPCACTPMDGSCTLLDPGMMFTGLTSFEGGLELPGGSLAQIVIE
jgi:hypothetical protein